MNNRAEPDARRYLIQDIRVHPDWKSYDDDYGADIAIAVLNHVVKFNDHVQAIKLPNPSYAEVSGNGTIVKHIFNAKLL